MVNGKQIRDTVFYQIPTFSFYDQHGNKISNETLAGKIWVASFTSFADNKNAPSLAVLMNRVEERTNLDTSIRIVTFTLDSESVKQLQDYANMIHTSDRRRIFLSGNKVALSELAVEGFYKPVDTSYANGFTHCFLIDKEGCIRCIYNGLLIKEIDNLVDDIHMLEDYYYIQDQKKRKDKDHDDAI